ncbi:transglycosylase SLT domain-containing protein [Acinetobacter haemolyticus]|uniref:transglycosylase SLT domain-containing protein n=1 Tax=Acinetobacter haemolyticus TaxID=29430 RepID=UPI0034D5DE6E
MRVPVLEKQVNEAQVPNVRVQGGLSPSEAVGVVSNQIDGITRLVNAGAQVYQQFQDDSDRIRVMDAENRLGELKNHLQNNKVDGFGNKRGVDVVGFDDGQGGGFVDYYSRAYQDGVNEIAATLGNNRQRQLFNQFVSKDTVAFKNGLQNYFVRENDTYQKSVYSASADRFVRNINSNPANFNAIDEDRLNLKAAINKSAQLDGKSALEAENIYLDVISKAHVNNINSFIENHDLRGAVQYRNNYQEEISLSDSFKANKWIQQKLEERQVDALVNGAISGTDDYSNPALNVPLQAAQQAFNELQNLSPDQMKNIKYNDQRLDLYTVHAAANKKLEWAAPLLLGIRLAGEKSNNEQVSPKGAKSVMQFMPATWGEYSKNGKRDINNPIDTIDAALEFVDWISKKYKTKDPMVIAAYYNGGGKAAEAVLKGKQPPATETRNYLERIDKWLSNDFERYASKPGKTRQQAYDEVWNSDVSAEVKSKAQTALNKEFAARDAAKKEQQTEIYNNLFKGINSGQFTYEQIPVNAIDALSPSQIKDLKASSKATYEGPIKTDPTVYSMIMLNKDELFKGKPQSVLHQYIDQLSPSDYKEVTKMYLDVNNPKTTKGAKERLFLANDSTVAAALKPYLNILGITDTKNKNQLLHYNAVKADFMQTMLEEEARNGGQLTWEQINRLALKNINSKVKITTSRPFFDDKVETNRVYAQVKRKADITPTMLQKIEDVFKKQGRNINSVTEAEYLTAYYAMMRRGF